MDTLLVALLAAVFLIGLGVLTLLVVVIVGIRAEERRMSLSRPPRHPGQPAGPPLDRRLGAPATASTALPLRAHEEVTVQTVCKIKLPGRHCQCGALRTGTDSRCEKCRARSRWYRHHCRRPRHAACRAPRASAHKTTQIQARGPRSAEES
jgi:hypothetical protein